MAQLIPKVDPREIRNVGERDVAMALADQLPDDCFVYHSYPWLRSDRNNQKKVSLYEGETDFVIVHPRAGILVLEVKGGEITYDADYRSWKRIEPSREVGIKDPFEQARKNAHVLEKDIRKTSFPGLDKIPCPYGYAVVFPHCEFSGKLPPGADSSMVFSAQDLERLGDRVTKLLGKWKRLPEPVQITPAQMKGIRSAISPLFKLMPVLFRQVQQQEDQLIRLTDEQLRLIDFLSNHERALISGVAGSGKTLMAGAQAQRFANAGKKTLFVCYNKGLAEWLQNAVPAEFSDLIHVTYFHKLCHDICKRANVKFTPKWDDGGTFWNETAAELLLDALDISPVRYDAVVVDEGQDFRPEWWLPLESINAEGDQGAFYIFYDSAQNLYIEDVLSLPNLGSPFELPTNCRNTRSIAKKCADILEVDIPIRDASPVGVAPEEIKIPDSNKRREKLTEVISEWISKGKMKPSQIAVLSPYEQAKSSLNGADRLRKIPLTKDQQTWREGKGVLFATIKGFKGLEADAVVLTDIPNSEADPYFNKADFYVACSRAKHLLVILNK